MRRLLKPQSPRLTGHPPWYIQPTERGQYHARQVGAKPNPGQVFHPVFQSTANPDAMYLGGTARGPGLPKHLVGPTRGYAWLWQGYGKSFVQGGELRDLPDWDYADGEPMPEKHSVRSFRAARIAFNRMVAMSVVQAEVAAALDMLPRVPGTARTRRGTLNLRYVDISGKVRDAMGNVHGDWALDTVGMVDQASDDLRKRIAERSRKGRGGLGARDAGSYAPQFGSEDRVWEGVDGQGAALRDKIGREKFGGWWEADGKGHGLKYDPLTSPHQPAHLRHR